MAERLLAHQLDGQGETVLLLNGGMMSIAAWDSLAGPIAEQFQVLRCDFFGQLKSPGEGHDALADHVADLLHLLDHLKIDRVHVLGVSFGAEAGLLLAATAPERVRSLIAVTATDYITDSFREGSGRMIDIIARILEGGDRAPFHDAMVEDIFSQDYVDAHGEELAARRAQMAFLPEPWFRGLDRLLRCTEKVDLRPHLARIQAPSLVVIASEDKVMLPERSRALATAIGAEVDEKAGSGHGLVIEHPEWLLRKCRHFLERHVSSDPPPPGNSSPSTVSQPPNSNP